MSGSGRELSIDSVTGIDVSLAIAGPGARSYAFLIDWHIRLLLALGWFVSAALIYNGRLSLAVPDSPHGRWFGLVLLPAAAVYFLYHWVLELAMRGRTPGKRLAGVHIVARDGGTATAGALLTRNVFRLIDSLPLCYGVGLIAVILTREHLRVGDMAAGTLLVYERDTPLPAAVRGSLDAPGMEIVGELLERWATLEPAARVQLARRVLARYALEPGDARDGSEAALHARLERLARP